MRDNCDDTPQKITTSSQDFYKQKIREIVSNYKHVASSL